MTVILHPAPAAQPWRAPHTRRLPGIQPVGGADWLTLDAAYAAQMAERERLLAAIPDRVLATRPEAEAAARELLSEVLALLRGRAGFAVGETAVTCPDGRRVALAGPPLAVLGRLVQEDLCLLIRPEDGAEHLLAGAVLCFPSSWTLAEKLGRPLAAIHAPVSAYDVTLAARVQRLCDGLRPGQPLWRANAHFYETADLHAPRPEAAPRRSRGAEAPFLRVERQTLLRLPESGAVAFAIHVSVTRCADLSPEDRAALGVPAGPAA
jgi:hypothetical protein